MISTSPQQHAAPLVPPVASPTGGAPSVLTATLVDDVLVLANGTGEVAVRVPLDSWVRLPAPADDGVPGTIARVCALDSALARRLFRRVSAWRPDDRGNLSARVRPTV